MTATNDSSSPAAPSAPVVSSARSTPDPSSRTRSGPVEVPVALVVAARKGDPAAFARIIEHWNPHLRPFVHHVLAGEGSTDRALSAAYVRAYRALPRYRAERKPGLWLHRIAYLAATDELRRVRRDPARRRALADAGRADENHEGAGDGHETLADRHWRRSTDAASGLDEVEVLEIDFGPDHRPPGAGAGPAAPAPDATSPTGPAQSDRPATPYEQTPPDAPEPVGTTAAEPVGTTAADPAAPGPVAGVAPDDRGPVESAGDGGVAGGPADPATDPESAIIEARNLMALTEAPAPDQTFPPGWRKLAPDQRALAVMIDLEDYRLDDAAAALDGEPAPAADRLSAARRLLARNRTNAVGIEHTDPHEHEELVAAARATLAEVPIPPADPDFWSILGRRLLAERESPAAPSIDPMARLAKAHPAEPGFMPNKHLRPLPGDAGYDPVQGLADQADWVRPPRQWRRIASVLAAIVVVAALIGVAVWVGTRSRIPDGSSAAVDLVEPVATAMAAGPYRQVSTTVTEEDASGRRTERAIRLIMAGDGSWLVSDTSTIDQTTYDATSGRVRRVAVVGDGDGAEVFANDVEGLAAGRPDPGPHVPSPLAEVQAVTNLLRLAGTDRVPRSTIDDQRVWRLTRTLPTGDRGEEEQWRVLIDTETSLPVQIERTRDDRVVRRVSIDEWSTVPEVAGDTFAQSAPAEADVTTTSHGFITTELAAVPLLGRGEAVTPGWLPPGFELAVVTVRADPPAGAPSTADGGNPADVGVLSLGFQRGVERITVTTRAVGGDRAAWSVPFAAALDRPRERSIGDGRFNGSRAWAGEDIFGSAHLWLIADDTVLTVSGDLTVEDAFRLTTSLR